MLLQYSMAYDLVPSTEGVMRTYLDGLRYSMHGMGISYG